MPLRPTSANDAPAQHSPDNCPLAAEQQAEKGRSEVAAWVLGVLTTLAISLGGWAHLRLWTDNDRLTKLETQREVEKQALEQRLNAMEKNLSEQIRSLSDTISRAGSRRGEG